MAKKMLALSVGHGNPMVARAAREAEKPALLVDGYACGSLSMAAFALE